MVKTMKLLPVLLFTATLCAQTWTPQTSNTRASLRGVSAVDARTVFASGSGGTWLATTDGGDTWRAAKVPGADSLDFRGIHAIDARTVYLMSAGPGDKSRIYKTTDAGEHWTLLFTNTEPKGFFDAIAFWDAQHGIVVGDQLEGHAEVLVTDDGGATWQQRTPPPGLPNEGSFAASNSCLTLFGRNDAWFATGGPGAARVFHPRIAAAPGPSPSRRFATMAPPPASSPSPSPMDATASRWAAITPKIRKTARTSRSLPTAAAPGLLRRAPARKASVPPSPGCPAASSGSSPAPPGPTSRATAARPGASSTAARITP